MKILVINGPNINMLGIREHEHYGTESYLKLIKKIKARARELNVKVKCYQSNHEGDIIDKIQASRKSYDGIIINPGGYTHTSIAIPDAVKAVKLPCVEVHISDVNNREDYRKVSYIREVCIATVSGKGTDGYIEALELVKTECEKK